MSFSNQVINPLRKDKPHIVKLQGLWRVSTYNHKKIWKTKVVGLWNEAHMHTNKLNAEIMAEQEAAKGRQREWIRNQKENVMIELINDAIEFDILMHDGKDYRK